jgi:hypothetical protein
MASELVRAVREHLAAEVATVIGGRPSSAAATNHRVKQPRGKSGVSDAVLGELLKAIKSAPGLRSEQIYKKVSISPKVAKAGLAKLREQKKVKTSGERRSTTYKAT